MGVEFTPFAIHVEGGFVTGHAFLTSIEDLGRLVPAAAS
jgi:hypothetical protein